MEGTKVKAVTFLIAALSQAAHGQLRAEVGDDCWYVGKCETGASDGQLIDTTTYPTFDEQVVACYELCKADVPCTDFTLNSIRGTPTCYLLGDCTLNTDDFCLDSGTCKSGPTDCAVADTNAKCLAIESADTAAGNIHWQCTDIDGVPFNGYTATDISAGSICVLRCESWEAQDGTDGYLTSKCQPDGTWEATKASDGAADLAFPQPDPSYPTPAEVQSFACGCQNLEVVWPLGDDVLAADQWWYDPSDEEGTDFVCKTPIDTENGDYTIETGNTCILFCDSHLVADVRCINGEWTGQPELGFWCYKQPEKENELGPVETEDPEDPEDPEL